MCMWLKRIKGIGCLLGVATNPVCVWTKKKVEAKDRLKDKYQYFILVLIMYVSYDSDL